MGFRRTLYAGESVKFYTLKIIFKNNAACQPSIPISAFYRI